MTNCVNIKGKDYSLDTLGLIVGTQNPEITNSFAEEYLLLCEVLDNPLILPFFLEKFYTMDLQDPENFRLALWRVQVDSDLRIGEDISKHQQRSYVTRTLEKLLFSEVLLEVVAEPDASDESGFLFTSWEDT
ncbi:hypothetical protein [Methanohalophilus profundi]|uniref:hypothetical protein n=1 Tax=Methanohalophilus profundi TaxID=2138083 RepID=UPI00101CC3DC|nr:hypothetical protein [Methanohalophilus profundi]